MQDLVFKLKKRFEVSISNFNGLLFKKMKSQLSVRTLPLLDQHGSQSTSIVWHITDDRTLVCLLPVSGTGEKKLQSIAEAVCDVTRTRGVTELRLVDHGITPKMKARGENTIYKGLNLCPC